MEREEKRRTMKIKICSLVLALLLILTLMPVQTAYATEYPIETFRLYVSLGQSYTGTCDLNHCPSGESFHLHSIKEIKYYADVGLTVSAYGNCLVVSGTPTSAYTGWLCEVICKTGIMGNNTVPVWIGISITCPGHTGGFPTCTSGPICSICHEEYNEPLGHIWIDPDYEWIEDDAKVKATATCQRDGSHNLVETVKTNFVLTQPSTFEDEGAGYYEAVFEDPIFQKQIKEVVVPPVECAGGDDCPSKNFTDMPSIKSTMHIPIDWAVVNKITTGTSPTTFGTKNSCTRAQFVTFLWRTRGQPEPTSTENPFTDVKESGFYYKAMLWAVEEGITAGTSPTTFGPNKPCTRAQVVTFLWRMEGSQEPASTENPFTDVKENGFYYKAMLWAVGKGITTGTSDTTFGPGSDCTRAQCVTFLYREFAQ